MKYLKQLLFGSLCLAFVLQNSWGMDTEEAPTQKSPPSNNPFYAARPLQDSTEEICVESMFLGPGSENALVVQQLFTQILEDHVYWRRNFHPDDPIHITEEIKGSAEYLRSQGQIQKHLRLLLADFKKSLPTSSFRYQGHINWEISIPAMLGYFAGLLNNSNNVAFEGSTATSFMEERVAQDFCKLIKYNVRPRTDSKTDKNVLPADKKTPMSWGQLTSGGTTANIQALWAARNLKFFPFAIQWALENSELVDAKEKLMVMLPDGKTNKLLKNLSPWELFNLESDVALNLPQRIHELLNGKKSLQDVYKIISTYSVQKKGLAYFHQRCGGIPEPVVFVPGTRHYSFPKAVSLLGMGEDSLINISVDLNARMNTEELEKKVIEWAENHRPIISVVAVLGSTEESAVDSLSEIIDIRKRLRSHNIDFSIHVDAAFGGYFCSLLKGDERGWKVPTIPLSQYVEKQFNALQEADSVTIDPHKSGYVPYPAGGLCYRDERLKSMTNFTAPVLATDEGSTPTVGIYGIEGSRPGAAAASVYLSHRVMPLTRQGHGKLLGQALYTTKEFFLRLLAIEEEDFFVVPLAQLPQQLKGRENYLKEKKELLTTIQLPKSFNDEEKLAKEQQIFKEKSRDIGPDLNMLVYAFNFYTEPKTKIPNKDLTKANAFNKRIYDKLSPLPNKEITEYKLILSNSLLEKDLYNVECLNDYMERLGITPPESATTPYSINVLRSVVMNPWATETEKGSMLEVVIKELINTAQSALPSSKDSKL